MFSPGLLEKISYHPENFVENRKYKNPSVQSFLSVVDEVERVSLNPIFIPA